MRTEEGEKVYFRKRFQSDFKTTNSHPYFILIFDFY